MEAWSPYDGRMLTEDLDPPYWPHRHGETKRENKETLTFQGPWMQRVGMFWKHVDAGRWVDALGRVVRYDTDSSTLDRRTL